MNNVIVGLRVACVVFALACLAQLARFLTGAELSVDGHLIPVWASGVASLVTGALSVWMGRLSCRA
jgi:hypothetical protein